MVFGEPILVFPRLTSISHPLVHLSVSGKDNPFKDGQEEKVGQLDPSDLL